MNRHFLGYFLLVGAAAIAAALILAVEAAGWETFAPGRPTLESLSTGGWRPAAPDDGRKRCYVNGRQVDCNTAGAEAGRIDAGGGGPIRGMPIVALVAVEFRPPPEERGPGSHSSRGCGVLIAADVSRPKRPFLVLTCAHLQDGHFRPWIETAPGPIGGGRPARMLADNRAFDLLALEVDGLPAGTRVLPLGTRRAPVGTCVEWHGLGADNPADFRSSVGLLGAGRITRWHNGFVYFEGRPSDGMSGGPVFWPGHGLQGILHGGAPGEAQAAGLDSIRRFLDEAGIHLDGARYTLGAADSSPIPLPDEQTIGPVTPEPDPAPPQHLTDTGGGTGSAASLVDAVIPPTSTADRARGSLEAKIDVLTRTIAGLLQAGATSPPTSRAPGQSTPPRSPPPAAVRDPPTRLDGAGSDTSGLSTRLDYFGAAAANALPAVLTALGWSTPPSLAALFALRLGISVMRRRREKKGQQTRAEGEEARDGARRSAWNLNDDYAEQLARVYQLSGRSPLADVTLGREYDEELRRAAESSDATLSKWARDIRDRVAGRFHRIHGASPVPAEPVASPLVARPRT